MCAQGQGASYETQLLQDMLTSFGGAFPVRLSQGETQFSGCRVQHYPGQKAGPV